MSPRESSASVKMVISAPNHAPAKKVMMVSIMLCLLPFLTNRAKIRHITDVVSVQFASAGAMVILVECALVVDA